LFSHRIAGARLKFYSGINITLYVKLLKSLKIEKKIHSEVYKYDNDTHRLFLEI